MADVDVLRHLALRLPVRYLTPAVIVVGLLDQIRTIETEYRQAFDSESDAS
jgi:hypothetical protein